MSQSYWPEASTDGRCGWCGQPLTEGEIFTIELEVAAWEQGERLFAPEHPALERRDNPIPSCRACRNSITTNYDQFVEEQRSKPIVDRISCTAMVVIFALTCLGFVLKTFGLI